MSKSNNRLHLVWSRLCLPLLLHWCDQLAAQKACPCIDVLNCIAWKNNHRTWSANVYVGSSQFVSNCVILSIWSVLQTSYRPYKWEQPHDPVAKLVSIDHTRSVCKVCPVSKEQIGFDRQSAQSKTSKSKAQQAGNFSRPFLLVKKATKCSFGLVL